MPKLAVVVNCVSGVAHSYIAKNAILFGAKKRGFEVNVEIQGTLGIENRLTPQQIADADVILLTKDLAIRDIKRFAGKKVLQKYYSRDLIKITDKVLDDVYALIEYNNTEESTTK